jgi:zinc protease
MTLGISYGAWTETRPGTASLAAAMITKGSAHHTAAELAEELEFHAISLGASATLDMATVFASCVSDKFDRSLRLLSEVVQTPKFPEDELDILRQQTMMGLMIQSKTPEYQADRELRRRLFGEHPYSRTATGEAADVQARKAGELREWWSSYVVPETSILYIAGDVTSAAAMEQAKAVFEDWRPSPPRPVVSARMPPSPSSTRIYLVDRPGSVQSQIRVGHLGITREHPDYFNALVLSQIFGGAFNSRLNKAIRVDKGLTYGARGGFRAERFAGTFTISTFTKTPATAEALQIILNEIDRITTQPPEPEELAQARSYMIGSFAGDRETPGATVNDLWLIHYARLPHDYFRRYFNGVRQATEESVQLAAKSLIRKDQLAIVVVGEAESIRALLKADPEEEKTTGEQPKSDGSKDP